MSKTVKLRQLTNMGTDKADISFRLSFPKMSNGASLFLEFIEIKKDYFKGNSCFSVRTEVPDDSCLESDLFVIQLNWIREIAQDCHKYIKDNLLL